MSTQALVLHNITLTLDNRCLLAIDTAVAAGEVLTVMGASGSGKSSLLAYIAGFLSTDFSAHGDIYLNGQHLNSLPAHHRGVGLLFQDPLLFPHMSVGGNLEFALPAQLRDRKSRVQQALAEVDLAGFADRDPDTLSGGQKSRVALQRLLLSQPRAVLLDEPFSRLDAGLRHIIREQVFSALRAAGLPTILVTHDADDAEAAGGRVISL